MSDSLLFKIAEEAMRARGFEPSPPPPAQAEAEKAREPDGADGLRDLRALPWSSIDNPESRDLDQIEAVERTADGMRLYVAIADVVRFAPIGSAIDRHAAGNTTTVYTGVRTFPMLPERLSFDLSSLVQDRPRAAMVIETRVRGGVVDLDSAQVYPALVENRAKLAYPSVSAWLDGHAAPPAPIADAPALREQVELQDALARALAEERHRAGALGLDTGELRIAVDGRGAVTGFEAQAQDRAGAIVEELMVASNRAVAVVLDRAGAPSIRRVVRRPERWPRIVEYAAERGQRLPAEPDSPSLARFLDEMRRTRPNEFHEISLAIVKLLGRGEYVAHRPGDPDVGHFGLATLQYAHSTAPNRRYPDLVTQRLLAAISGSRALPYDALALEKIASRSTEMEAAAQKVERRVQKSAAALLLQSRVGERFDAIVTGAGEKGTFVRIFAPLVEGKLVRDGNQKVGDKIKVKLVDVSVEKGFIDFARVS